MCPANSISGFTSAISTLISQDGSNQEDPDIWFNAIDHVEMDDTWFEGAEAFSPHEEHHASPSSSGGEAADYRVPFTEDCRRGVQQFVHTLGEYGESRMLSACLSGLLPDIPASLITAADSLYTAVTERRNIDTAALHALGLASGYLPENINTVSWLATFIRDTVTGWTDETFLQQFLGNEENHTSIHLFTALAVTAIVAGRWMKDEGAPQRGVLNVPAFMANIFIRASHYWTALGNMVSSLPSGAEIPENTGLSQRAPAFEIDTRVEMTGNVCDTTRPCSSAPRLTAFSSNSTAHPEAYTRATVQNRPALMPGKSTRLSVPEQAHYLATEKLRKESGLSDLMYCINLKTETRQQINEKVITDTYFNTKCGATAYPEPLTKGTDGISVHADIPETQVSSAATSQSSGDVLLPLVAAAVIPAATAKMQALKSKTMITAGVITGLTGSAIGGKMLWNKLTQHNAEESKLKTNTGDIFSIFAQHHVGSKPVNTSPLPAPSTPWFNDIPDNADLQSAHFNFDNDISYQLFSDEKKRQTYLYAIKFLLLKIENDERSTAEMKKNAYLARLGAEKLVTVNIGNYRLNNELFLPDSDGSTSGILISLDSDIPYYYIRTGRDLPGNLSYNLPFGANNYRTRVGTSRYGYAIKRQVPRGVDIINNIIAGKVKFKDYFNCNNPKSMTTTSIAETLTDSIGADYKSKKQTLSNRLIIARAITGARIPDPNIRVTEVKQPLEFTWEDMTPGEYLRSFSRPFSTLSGQMQLIISSTHKETISVTEKQIYDAEYIGSWIDITAGTFTSLTPMGWVLNTAQSASGLITDFEEGKPLNQLNVAGLVAGCIPGGKIAAEVGKFSRIGGDLVKYGIRIENKVLDIAILGDGIKTAVDTGEPLAIYQAFLNSGMSAHYSYEMAMRMSLHLNIGHKNEGWVSPEALNAILKNSPHYDLDQTMSARKFKFGSTEMLGRITKGKLEISTDYGNTWMDGTELHLLAYRLQNAGGRRFFNTKVTIGGYSFKEIKYNKDKLRQMEKIAIQYSQTSEGSSKVADILEKYRSGKASNFEPWYDYFNDWSADKLFDLYIESESDHYLRGVLAKKINTVLHTINSSEVAFSADDWARSAAKSVHTVLLPQNIFLKGKPGECLPETVLMGWALKTEQDRHLSTKLMNIYSSPNVSENTLYKSLLTLHIDGNSSKFGDRLISDIYINSLDNAESKLFMDGATSVRVDFNNHTTLLSKVNRDDGVRFVFYDPNYGLAYFKKYKDMVSFFKKKIANYLTTPESVIFRRLDYSGALNVKIRDRNLNEIIDGEIPESYKQDGINIEGYDVQTGIHFQGNKKYIYYNDGFYQVEWDQEARTWKVFDPEKSRLKIPVKRDVDAVWFKSMDIVV